MILTLLYYGSKWLRHKAHPVTTFDDVLRQHVDNMIETMHAHNGIGLAATQVGIDQRIFITCVPEKNDQGEWKKGSERVYINPEVTNYSDDMLNWEEGCLSIPRIYEYVARPKQISIEYQDLEGNSHSDTLVDFHACNFLHENDHLNGVLFVDRLSKRQKNLLKNKLNEIKKKYRSK